FKNATLKTIILKLAGWHGYQVMFPPDLSELTFSGSISRSGCFVKTLQFLERMTGHKIVVKNMKIEVIAFGNNSGPFPFRPFYNIRKWQSS
ncbi:MAG TPA: DUF4974 domain-containing protein, partial [Anaerovoracaceae bacterium]|nr:DUF4974 domain-containing protein [Anaerovoracaceae bacterium]